MPIQWLLTLFAVFAVGKAVKSFRKQQLDKRKLSLWVVLWLGFVIVLWQPNLTSVVASYLGVGRGVDAALYLAVAFMFYMLFMLSRKVDRLDRSLTELVRALALENEDESSQD